MLAFMERSTVRRYPILTPRLLLIPLEQAASSEFLRAVDETRPLLTPWLPWAPFVADDLQSTRYCEACETEWDQGRSCRFAVRDRQSHTLVGVVGFENIQLAHASCDLGYWLRAGATKRGLMTEACAAALQWVFATLGMHRVRVAASTQNSASIRVIERLGFRHEGTSRQAEWCDNRWLDHEVFGMLVSDPRKQ